jgi:hypothetical protein
MITIRRAVVALTLATFLFSFASVAEAQPRYQNLVNDRFATISSGPQSALIVDVPSRATDAETRDAVTKAVNNAFIVKAQGFSAQLQAAERAGLIKRGAVLPLSSLVMTRKSGRLVKSGWKSGRAVGGGKLTFRFTGFTANDTLYLQTFLNDAYPRLEAVYGSPAVSGEVEIVNAGNLENSTIPEVKRFAYGVYDVSNNRILLPLFVRETASLQALLLNVVHAFHGPAVFQYDAWEEGFARAVSCVILRDFVRDPELAQKYAIDDPSANSLFSLLRFYDLLNQPALGNSTFFPPSQANLSGLNGKFTVVKMLWARIGMSGAAWLKVYIENPSFFRDFNAAYYARFEPNATPSIAGNVPVLRSLAAPLLPDGVEDISWNDWFQRQYVLDTSVSPGTKLFPFVIPAQRDVSGRQTTSVTLVYYRTEKSGDETLLNDRAYASYFDDNNSALSLGSGSEQTNIVEGEGGFSISTTNAAGSDATRLTMEFTAGDQSARTYLPVGFDGDFQGVILLKLGAKNMSVVHTTLEPVNVVSKTGKVEGAAFGVFRSSDGGYSAAVDSDLGKSVVEVSDGANTRRWRFNTGQGQYYAILRDGAKGAGVITVTQNFDASTIPYLISPPVRPLSSSISEALSLPPTDFLLSYWDTTRSTYETFVAGQPSVAPLQPGRGYWLKIAPPDGSGTRTVKITGTPPVTDTDFAIPCAFGWNLVGSPFEGSIDLTKIQVKYLQNGLVDWQTAVDRNYIAAQPFAFDRTTGQYATVNAFSGGLWQGYWLRVLVPGGVTLYLPGPEAPNRSRATGSALVPTRATKVTATRPDWTVKLRAKSEALSAVSGPVTVATAEFGAASDATRAFDNRFDRESPPSILPGIVAEFVHDDWDKTAGGRYVADYRPLTGSASETWTVAITAPTDGPVSLTWGGMGSVPHRTNLTLTDVKTGQRVSLHSRSSYRFNATAGESRRFTIAADSAASLPLMISNLSAVTTRAAGASSITFNYMVTRAADVTIEVATLSGKVMRRLAGGRATAAGQQRVHWDGRAENASALPPGPYSVTLTARDDTGANAQMRRVITVIQ